MSELTIAIEAAKIGADVALSYFDNLPPVEYKEDKSVVTKADRETEKAIKNALLKAQPSARFVGEETGGNVNEDEFWIVDPIDGTRSFVRGISTWCVLLALCKNKEIVLGVAYFPLLNELFYAQKDKGAFKNKKPIHVSNISTLEDAYVSYGSLRHFKNPLSILNLVKSVATARSPEATYATCLVAGGKFEAHVDAYAQLWDAAPFRIIIPEAGGTITNLEGKPLTFSDRGFIATNRKIHKDIVRLVNSDN